jgi:hypothetical protein
LLGVINPKPFVSLKNFTVPCCIIILLNISARYH